MAYELQPILGRKLSGEGYPLVAESGEVKLLDKNKTFQPTEYRWVKVTSEASPDMSAASKGKLLVSGSPRRGNPARPSTRRG